ncbi:Glutaredoxin [uncultured archaeon]|nr:Glutaredoxin [uncultured archaeon]
MTKKIKIYTLPWCPHCNSLKEYLKKNKHEFENINVEEDDEAAEDIIERTGQDGFPIIVIDDEVIIGFDANKIEELLNKDK